VSSASMIAEALCKVLCSKCNGRFSEELITFFGLSILRSPTDNRRAIPQPMPTYHGEALAIALVKRTPIHRSITSAAMTIPR